MPRPIAARSDIVGDCEPFKTLALANEIVAYGAVAVDHAFSVAGILRLRQNDLSIAVLLRTRRQCAFELRRCPSLSTLLRRCRSRLSNHVIP